MDKSLSGRDGHQPDRAGRNGANESPRSQARAAEQGRSRSQNASDRPRGAHAAAGSRSSAAQGGAAVPLRSSSDPRAARGDASSSREGRTTRAAHQAREAHPARDARDARDARASRTRSEEPARTRPQARGAGAKAAKAAARPTAPHATPAPRSQGTGPGSSASRSAGTRSQASGAGASASAGNAANPRRQAASSQGSATASAFGKVRRGFASLGSATAPAWFANSKAAGKALASVDPAKRWNVFRVLLALVVALLVVYLGGVVHYSSTFYPSSTIGPVEVSDMDCQAAADALEQRASGYQLTVTGNDVEFMLAGEEAGLSLEPATVAQNALSQNNGWCWPFAILFPHDYSSALSASANKDKLKSKITEEVENYNLNADPPEDATIKYNKDTGVFDIVEEKQGNSLDSDAVIKDAAQAIGQLSDTLTLTDADYRHPSITQDDERLSQARKDALKILQADLKYTLAGNQVVELKGEQAASWATTDDQAQLVLDANKVGKWCNKMDKKYSTRDSKRVYTRPDGATITVSGGDYGWLLDLSTLAGNVTNGLLNGSTETAELPTTQTADTYNPETGIDWKSYVDVDITAQHATYYDEEGNVLWESDVVTGTPGGDRETPTGVYSINAKESPSTLKGVNLKTGKRSYTTKVAYWMPFDQNVIGFHDATWQSEFGGTRYQDGYGSNGCVNLPKKKAKELYNLVSEGTVVVSHK